MFAKPLTNEPDIAFTSPYVSKKHAVIEVKDDSVILTDTMSKHGTPVNGNRISANVPYQLRDGDEINLARGEVAFLFYSAGQGDIGVTRDFSGKSRLLVRYDGPLKGMVINEERHQVFIDGKPVKLAGKDIQRQERSNVKHLVINMENGPENPTLTPEFH